MLQARRGGFRDTNRVGLTAPPIETPRGWLMLSLGADGDTVKLSLWRS